MNSQRSIRQASRTGRRLTGAGTFFALVLFVAFSLGFAAAASSHGLLPVALPEDALLTVLVLSPAPVAVLLAAHAGGWHGVRGLLARLRRWRVPAVWYMVALLTPAALNGTALLLHAALGGATPELPGQLAPEQQLVPPALLPIYFLIPSCAEEVGWRGYALPRLQRRHTALTASVLIGLVWAVWHLPMAFVSGSTQGTIPFGSYIVATIATAVLFTWLYNSSGGSLLLVTLLHASLQATYVLLPVLPTATGGPAVYNLHTLVAAVLAATVVAMTGSPTLTRNGTSERGAAADAPKQ